MKKLIYSMLALAITTLAFTSCEDVPAPFDTCLLYTSDAADE